MDGRAGGTNFGTGPSCIAKTKAPIYAEIGGAAPGSLIKIPAGGAGGDYICERTKRINKGGGAPPCEGTNRGFAENDRAITRLTVHRGATPVCSKGQKCRDALSSWMQGRCRDKARCYRYSNRSRNRGSTHLRDNGRGPTAAAARTGPETPDRPYRLIAPALVKEPRRWLRAASHQNY